MDSVSFIESCGVDFHLKVYIFFRDNQKLSGTSPTTLVPTSTHRLPQSLNKFKNSNTKTQVHLSVRKMSEVGSDWNCMQELSKYFEKMQPKRFKNFNFMMDRQTLALLELGII